MAAKVEDRDEAILAMTLELHALRQQLAEARRAACVVPWPSGVLNKNDTLDILRQHNKWRRGADGPQTDPRMLGLALDAVVAHLSELAAAPPAPVMLNAETKRTG
jgi:hypothetical protein